MNRSLIFLATALVFICCRQNLWARSESKIVIGELPKKASAADQLELPITSIDLRGVTMTQALDKIAEDVLRLSHGKWRFQFLTRFAREREYIEKGIPNAQWKQNDPNVEIHLKNTTLRDVVNNLCAQSGWSYSTFRGELGFIDDRSYFGGRH